jgi:hypothetical protein
LAGEKHFLTILELCTVWGGRKLLGLKVGGLPGVGTVGTKSQGFGKRQGSGGEEMDTVSLSAL